MTLRLANAPCSWGILEFGPEGSTAGFPQVLDEMRAAGFAGTELGDWGFLPTDPQRLKQALAKRDLALVGAFVPVNLSRPAAHAGGQAQALRTARLLAEVAGGQPVIVLADDNGKDPVRTQNAGRIHAEHGLSAARWQVLAEGAERIARAVRVETGLRTAFHHHCAGFVETPAEVDRLLALTDPQVLGLCFDTGHYRFGGGDVLTGLERHAGRIWHVHLKDHAPQVAARSRAQGWDYFQSVRAGLFCELGRGDVPFAAVKAELDRLAYAGWVVVEQDVPPGMGTPLDSARRNRAFLSSIGVG